jgi:hypothetical protein
MDESTWFLLLLLPSWFCAILKEIVQVNERFLLALRSLLQATGLFFKRSLFMRHMFPMPIIHWMILQPFIFVNVSFWVKLKSIVASPWRQLFLWRTPLQLYVSSIPFHQTMSFLLFFNINLNTPLSWIRLCLHMP